MKKYVLISIILCTILLGICGCGNKTENDNTHIDQSNERDETVAQLEVINEFINIREAKNTSSKVIGKVYEGEIYTILSEDDESKYNWYEIETSNGIKGYISGQDEYVKLLSVNSETEPEPEKETTDTKKPTSSNNVTKPNTNSSSNNSNSSTSSKPNESTNNSTNNSTSNETNTPSTNKEDNNSNNSSTDNTESKNEKRVIEATQELYCEDGYTLINNILVRACEKYEYSEPKLQCQDDFREQDGKCVGITKPNKDATIMRKCSNGSLPKLDSKSRFYCSSGSLVEEVICPNGYNKLSLGNDSYTCVWHYNGVVIDKSIYCPDGTRYDERAQKCVKTISKAIQTRYVCPKGYTLNGEKCYEN